MHDLVWVIIGGSIFLIFWLMRPMRVKVHIKHLNELPPTLQESDPIPKGKIRIKYDGKTYFKNFKR